MSEIKVSIIVPVYNVEKYLPRCLESLVNQTLKEIEIIIIDDESPDNCPELCDKYAKQDCRIKVIHKKNGGLGLARNSGIDYARGQFVAFVDSDDFVEKNMYEDLYNETKVNNLDTCFCRYSKYYNTGKIEPIVECNKRVIWRGRKEIDSFLMEMLGSNIASDNRKFSMSVCKAIYSMDFITENRIRFLSERDVASEDLFFHIDYLSQAHNVGWLPKSFYYYFHNNQSITTTYNALKFSRIKNAMAELSTYLDKYYSYTYYRKYYYGELLRLQRAIISQEIKRQNISFFEKRRILKVECNEPLLKFIDTDLSFANLPFKLKIYLFAIKHSLVDVIYFLNKVNDFKK